ncbi:DUF2878 domain-containing protein [Vibrio sp. M250220]|uniref:DUF2878 domain-containing protein n=1 Tax=Vibrio sp. M250220 TaxID=3020894 RepID=UPI002F3F641A
MKRLILISTWFQIIWFVAVIGQTSWHWLTLLLVTFTLLITAMRSEFAWKKLAVIVAVGISVDSVNMALGLLHFEQGYLPLWLVSLWVIFAWYCYFLYPVVSQYPLSIVSVIGGIGGALSYSAGEKLNAVTFGLPIVLTAGILLIEWTIMVLLIFKVYGYENHPDTRHLSSSDS